MKSSDEDYQDMRWSHSTWGTITAVAIITGILGLALFFGYNK